MDTVLRRKRIESAVETAFVSGIAEDAGTGQAFAKLIEYLVTLEQRVEYLEDRFEKHENIGRLHS